MKNSSNPKHLFAALCAAAVSAFAVVTVDESRLLPGSVLHFGDASKSGWIWNADEKIKNGGESFYRLSFVLEDEVEDARFLIRFDDSGHFTLNGKIVAPSTTWDTEGGLKNGTPTFAKGLVKGRNVLAAYDKNGAAQAGMIFLGEIRLRNGKAVFLHSDRTVKAAAKAPVGWDSPDFDDSQWKTAAWIGDAKCWPWGERGGMDAFMTLGELARYEREEETGRSLPTGIENEPEPVVKIVYDGNRPKISFNGELMEPDFNLIGPKQPWRATQLMRFAAAGIHFHKIQYESGAFWKDEGVYDFSCFDKEARRILRLDPQAKLMLSFRLTMEGWCRKHPGEEIKYADYTTKYGGHESYGCPLRPSPASAAFREECSRLFAALGEYVRSMPWGKRVFAVQPHWGIYTEWHMYGMARSPDISRPMVEAFHRYLGGRYAKESPPMVAERRAENGFVLNAVTQRKTIDYYNCMAEEVAALLLHCARAIKRSVPGRLVGAYYGYVLTGQPPEGANVLLDRVLASPDIDFLSDPPEYIGEIRRAGGAFHHRSIPSMFVSHGKLPMLEDDTRYFNIKPWENVAYTLQSDAESRAVMRRNYLSKLFDLCGVQYCDPASRAGLRPGMFDDPTVLDALAESKRVVAEIGAVDAETGNEVAYVIRPRDRFRTDPQAKESAKALRSIYNFNTAAMFASGVPFDILEHCEWERRKSMYKLSLHLDLDNPVVRTAAEWAKFFREKGIEPMAEPGDVVRRRGGLVMLHTAKAGRHVLRLPGAADVRWQELFSGGDFASGVVALDTDGPFTWIFKKGN